MLGQSQTLYGLLSSDHYDYIPGTVGVGDVFVVVLTWDDEGDDAEGEGSQKGGLDGDSDKAGGSESDSEGDSDETQ